LEIPTGSSTDTICLPIASQLRGASPSTPPSPAADFAEAECLAMASQRRHPRCHRDSLGSDKDNHAGPLSTTCVCFSIATTTCGYILAVTSLPVRSVISSLATVSHTLQLLQLRITCLNSRGNPVSNYRSTTTNTTAREGYCVLFSLPADLDLLCAFWTDQQILDVLLQERGQTMAVVTRGKGFLVDAQRLRAFFFFLRNPFLLGSGLQMHLNNCCDACNGWQQLVLDSVILRKNIQPLNQITASKFFIIMHVWCSIDYWERYILGL
jgi:hypothetical protein